MILQAARAEFVTHGFAGARTRGIAKRAGVHEWMVFYCFKSKRNLYREVLSEQLAERTRQLAQLPADLPTAVEAVFNTFAANPDMIRLFQWEALTVRKGELIAARERRAAYRQGGEAWLEGLKRKGALPTSIDMGLFRLAMFALASFPFAFPQLVKLAAGVDSEDARFRERWLALLRWFVGRMLTDASTGALGRAGRRSYNAA